MLACVCGVPSPHEMSATYSDDEALGSVSEMVATVPVNAWPSAADIDCPETVKGGSARTTPPGPPAVIVVAPPHGLPGPSLHPFATCTIARPGEAVGGMLITSVPSVWPGSTVAPLSTGYHSLSSWAGSRGLRSPLVAVTFLAAKAAPSDIQTGWV